jgi:hypothetical protein
MKVEDLIDKDNIHGCYAVVGDLVEILSPMGKRTGIHGLIQSENHWPSKHFCRERILQVYWIGNDGPSLESVKDSFVRIVSRGKV